MKARFWQRALHSFHALRSVSTFVLPIAVAILLCCAWSANLQAALVLHSTLDNVDVGAGAGSDSTQNGAFTVFDIAGTPQNGTAEDFLNTGATASAHVTSGAAGQINQALNFPASTASNRAVTYGDVHDVGTGNYSVSLWFNATNTSGTEVLASKGNAGSSDEGWNLFIQDSSVFARMSIGGAGALDRASMSDTFTANEWHHVALVIDNASGDVTGYLDGDEMANLGGGGPSDNLFTAGSDISTTDPLTLAIRSDGGAEFQGNLDDFAIFDMALSANEVSAIYRGGLNGLNVQQALIPEPQSITIWALLAGGAALLVLRHRRRRG